MTFGTVTTVDEAIAMERAGVDAVVASGFEAGGHRISFLRPADDSLIGTLALIPQVVDAVRIPVVAAGGIGDGRGIAAALCLGAQAAQIGTAFLACDESAASDLHREQLRSPQRSRHSAHARFHRPPRSRHSQSFHRRDARTRNAVPPYPVQAWLTAQHKQAAIAQERADILRFGRVKAPR